MVGECMKAVGASVGGGSSFNKMPTLEEYGANLTKLAKEGLIRIRPLSNIEKVSKGYMRCLKQDSAQTLEKLFRVAGLPMVENCLSGYNSCMFAYGQTGSGKTYTMMGEINEVEGKLNEDCGITPQIFEYLFSRIIMEEENSRDERLKFSCKCSFLEIYNEQITDLLEPSSTNLLIVLIFQTHASNNYVVRFGNNS